MPFFPSYIRCHTSSAGSARRTAGRHIQTHIHTSGIAIVIPLFYRDEIAEKRFSVKENRLRWPAGELVRREIFLRGVEIYALHISGNGCSGAQLSAIATIWRVCVPTDVHRVCSKGRNQVDRHHSSPYCPLHATAFASPG